MNRSLSIIIAIALIIVGWAIYNQNPKELPKEKVYVGLKGLARSNDFLALQRYYEDKKRTVQSTQTLNINDLDQNIHFLFGSLSSLPQNEADIYKLMKWIKQGGKLLTGFHTISTSEALNKKLLKELGFTRQEDKKSLHFFSSKWKEEEEIEEKDLEPEEENDEPGFWESLFKIDEEIDLTAEKEEAINPAIERFCEHKELKDIIYKGNIYSCEITKYDPSLKHLRYSSQNQKENNELIFHHQKKSKGDILFISDLNIFSNLEIAHASHAQLFTDILDNTNKKMLFVFRDTMPSTWHWLSKNMPMSCLLFLGWILLALWHFGRFGPIKKHESEEKKLSIQNHVSAVATYLWNAKKSKVMIETITQDLQRHLPLHYREMGYTEECFQYFSEKTKLDISEIKNAFTKTHHDKESFTKAIQVLQTLKQKLSC